MKVIWLRQSAVQHGRKGYRHVLWYTYLPDGVLVKTVFTERGPECCRYVADPKSDKKAACRQKIGKTYNTSDSLVVTDPTTNLALFGLSMGEQTGSPSFPKAVIVCGALLGD
jgi:hypothetical protein